MNLFSTKLDITAHPAIVAPITRQHTSVAPVSGHPTNDQGDSPRDSFASRT